jgi:hypothetical protein
LTGGETVSDGWQALTGDPIQWLLDVGGPNLQWRVLVDLVRRPSDSPAVVRARGGANIIEPVASLLADFDTEVGWRSELPAWQPYDGPGWRIVAAVQWGADPSDPRLAGAARRLLAAADPGGGFRPGDGRPPDTRLTARVLQALAALGWCREPGFGNQLAWLAEGTPRAPGGGWLKPGGEPADCPTTVAAVAGLVSCCGDRHRRRLEKRVLSSLEAVFESAGSEFEESAFPCLEWTDTAELLQAAASLGAPLTASMRAALHELQHQQTGGGRWRRRRRRPESLAVGDDSSADEPCPWVTLKSVAAVLHYAVEAGLPRMYPQRPSG